jgi:hypothetical protein
MADRDGSSLLWFLAGLGMGAVVGVLYAPLAGSETRRAILERAEGSNGLIVGARFSTSRKINSVRLMKQVGKPITKLRLRRVVETPRTFEATRSRIAPAAAS